MSKKMLIDATHAEETRVVVVDGNRVEEFDFETINKRQLAGNIYLAKVTRVEPSLQAAFVDYGGNRHGFLAFAEIHPDYYQIPLADRKALIEEERALARAEEDEDNRRARPTREDRPREEAASRDGARGERGDRGDRRGRSRGRGRGPDSRREGLAGGAAEGEAPQDTSTQDALNPDTAIQDLLHSAPDFVQDQAPLDGPNDAPMADAAAQPLTSAAQIKGQTLADDRPDDFADDFGPETGEDTGPGTMAHPIEGDETLSGPDLIPEPSQAGDVASPSGMELVDLAEDDLAAENDARHGSAETDAEPAADLGRGRRRDFGRAQDDDGEEGERFRAIDHASDSDDEIESIAEEDIAEEIAAPRRPRARRYKIQEVIKVRQIMLVQVVKEERGNKGAALTTYLSLAGRYCVLMPNTARGGGISRKIVQAADRKKLKEIAQEIEVPEGAGLIIRTAGAKRTKPEIKRDYEYLMRLWEQIRDLTLKSMAPAAIYEEGDLIKRTIRDLYSSEIEEILVEGEAGYRTAKDFMRMIMPAHAKQVIRYTDPTPLFARYGVESYLSGMFNPTVQLKSGGYIVIGITEALVAIDVNSGRATKEGSIEDTALKTNLEAADEVARQLRLRDLAGLIVIDFIDMEERRNNAAVEKRLKDRLKTDRARIQVGRISGFGLMEMSRQRLRPGMLESTTQPCAHCHGTGLIRSDDSLGLQVLRALEEEGTRKRSREVLLRAPIGIVNFLINNKREHIALIEARTGMSVRIEADPAMISPDFTIEKFKTATRALTGGSSVISGNASLMGAPVAEDDLDHNHNHEHVDEPVEDLTEAQAEAVPEISASAEPRAGGTGEGGAGDAGGKKRRRRRRRKLRNGAAGAEAQAGDDAGEDLGDDAGDQVGDGDDEGAAVPEAGLADTPVAADAPPGAPAPLPEAKPKRTRAPRGGKKVAAAEEAVAAPVAQMPEEAADGAANEAAAADAAAPQSAAKPKASGKRTRSKAPAEVDAAPSDSAAKPASGRRAAKPKASANPPEAAAPTLAETPLTAPLPAQTATTPPVAAADVAPQVATAPETAAATQPGPNVEAGKSDPDKPRKRGWWSAR